MERASDNCESKSVKVASGTKSIDKEVSNFAQTCVVLLDMTSSSARFVPRVLAWEGERHGNSSNPARESPARAYCKE